MAGNEQEKPVEHHVLKDGVMFGPLTKEDLRAGVVDGRFHWGDFVQVEGQVIWQSLARVLDASAEEVQGAVPPDWRCILKWARMRLRCNLENRGWLVGLMCLALGVLALVLSNWPFVFWLPWFVVAALVAVGLFRRKRKVSGALILLAVICVPWLFQHLRPKTSVEKGEHAIPPQRIGAEKARGSEPSAAPVIATNVSESSVVPVPVVTLPPDNVVTLQPHYGPVPAEATESAQPGTTVEPGKLASTVGKLAGAVVPFLAEKTKVSLPSLPSLPGLPVIAPPPAANEEKDLAAIPIGSDVLQSRNDVFVVVKGSNDSGCGFACRQGGKTWLLSNIHVLAEIKQAVITRLDGVAIPLGAAEAAAGPDIVRMVLAQPPEHPLEAITDFEANVHIEDDIAVVGRLSGGGVATWSQGRVVGISPDRVEVAATFIPGNSGGPIIHLKTGKVIGVTSYLNRPYEQYSAYGGNGSAVIRHFGYRIDKVPAWEPVNWPGLYADADQIEQVSKLTTDIFDFLDSVRKQKDPKFSTATLRRPGQEWVDKMHASGLSPADRRSAKQGFLNALHFLVRADLGPAEARLRYSYFRNRLNDEKTVRDRIFQAFDAEGGNLGSPLSRPGDR